jgi:hypothetical protein
MYDIAFYYPIFLQEQKSAWMTPRKAIVRNIPRISTDIMFEVTRTAYTRRLIYRNFTTILLTYILLHKSDTCALTCSDRMSLKSEKLSREIEEAMRPEAYMKWPTIATWPKYYRDNFFEVVYFRRRIKTRILFGVPREITLFYVLFTLLYYPNKTVWKL